MALEWIQGADVTVAVLERDHRKSAALVEISAGGTPVRFCVEGRLRAPYPNELRDLDDQRRTLERRGHPLLVAPYVAESLGRALIEAGWSWADDQGNYDLRAPGLRLGQRRTRSAPKPTRHLLPAGSGSWAIIRTLVAFENGGEDAPTVTALARMARVSQPRASQVLGALAELGLVRRTDEGGWRADRSTLLDRFLDEYRGPGGATRFLSSTDRPSAVAIEMARRNPPHSFVISADVGPDIVAPWRQPSVVVVYSTMALVLDELHLVDAQGLADANVIIREPRDRSVFPNPPFVADADGVELPLVHPTQMIWDLHDLGGADRFEAAGVLRHWLLQRP